MSLANEPPGRRAIIDFLCEQDAPVEMDDLIDALEVGEAAQFGFERRLAAMQRDGQILQNRKGGFMPVDRLDLVAGRVAGHRDGFGFLIPDDGSSDVFLPPRQMQKVMHGDRVLVRRAGVDPRGRPEGSIVEVTSRAHRVLVGRLVSERGVLLVVPEDQRIKHDVLVPPAETQGAIAGQVVSVEIVEPPTHSSPPIGRVVEILGELDDPGMEIEIAVRKFDVPHQFPQAALDDAEALPDKLRPADYRSRVDLRDVPLVTIDGEDARDFDDAVYCEPMAGGWRLLVAIADVSHYVKPGFALDAEAQSRATSVYFPRRVIPMLPEKLSNGLCSLNPAVDRLVLVADMAIDARGNVKAYQFYPAVMHSVARLTYDEVWGILSGRDPGASARRKELLGPLNDLYALYRLLAKARDVRGAIDFDTVETKIICDPNGRIESIVARSRNDAHRLIEECMLSANTCAADLLTRHKHAGLYRVHEGPTPDRLAKLRQFLSGLGLALGEAGSDPGPKDYQTLSQKIAGREDSALLQTMMLRSMQQAIYTPVNSGHFGLAYSDYAHFTSPIRRYPDLLNHRAIKAVLAATRYEPQVHALAADTFAAAMSAKTSAAVKASAATKTSAAAKGSAAAVGAAAARAEPKSRAAVAGSQAWEQLGIVCSTNERRADDATRDVEAWLKCEYMRERVGEEFRGRITGVAPFGIFVTLETLYVEGMVHVSELGAEYFQYSESSHEMRGERTGKRYRLTDEIDVQVARVDMEGRRIEFRLIGIDGGAARGSAGSRGDERGRKDASGRDRANADSRRKPADGTQGSKAQGSKSQGDKVNKAGRKAAGGRGPGKRSRSGSRGR